MDLDQVQLLFVALLFTLINPAFMHTHLVCTAVSFSYGTIVCVLFWINLMSTTAL